MVQRPMELAVRLGVFTMYLLLTIMLGFAAPSAIIPPEASVEVILDHVDRRSASLETYVATVRLDSTDGLSEETERRFGRVYFTAAPRRAAIVFERSIDPSGRARERLEHYVFADGVLSDYDHEAKRLIRRELVKPGETTDPLRLGEGPVPIPFAQRKADILRAFDVTPGPPPPPSLVKDPACVVGLHLVPKDGTRLANQNDLASIDLWIDRTTASPLAIQVNERDGDVVASRFFKASFNAELDETAKKWLLAPDVDPREWRIESR
jgi:outer membrane lipoprotein-sorting protein